MEQDADKAMLFRDYFQSLHQTDSVTNVLSIELQPETETVPSLEEFFFSMIETRRVLEGLDGTKAAGPDGIHPQMVKKLSSILASPLTELYNRSMSSGMLPEDWKRAIVVPIHKGQSKSSVEN